MSSPSVLPSYHRPRPGVPTGPQFPNIGQTHTLVLECARDCCRTACITSWPQIAHRATKAAIHAAFFSRLGIHLAC
jgi:hypothetical protein